MKYGFFKHISAGNLFHVFVTLIVIVWLATRSTPELSRFKENVTSTNIFIISEIVEISDRLCLLWTLSRDKVLQKYNFPLKYIHRYGLEFNIKNNKAHIFLCILLAGAIATNPDPTAACRAPPHLPPHQPQEQKLKQHPVTCLVINARSLKSQHTLESKKLCNLSCLSIQRLQILFG